MSKKLTITLIINFALIFLVFAAGSKKGVIKKSEPITKEKELDVRVDFGNGSISTGVLENGLLFETSISYSDNRPGITYNIIGNRGQLDIQYSGIGKNDEDEESHIISSLDKIYDNDFVLMLSPEIPLNLDMEFGVIKGVLELGALKVEEAKFEIGVSKGAISFEKPNLSTLRLYRIEGGIGKLRVEKIGNANVEQFEFDGGVGSYDLDFSGEYHQNTHGKITIGMGSVVLRIPRKLGTRLKIEKSFLTSCQIDKIYKEGDFYYNDNWEKTEFGLDLDIETNIGKLEIIWID